MPRTRESSAIVAVVGLALILDLAASQVRERSFSLGRS